MKVRDSEADVSSVSPSSERSASESLYGGLFTLSTQLIKPNLLHVVILTISIVVSVAPLIACGCYQEGQLFISFFRISKGCLPSAS